MLLNDFESALEDDDDPLYVARFSSVFTTLRNLGVPLDIRKEIAAQAYLGLCAFARLHLRSVAEPKAASDSVQHAPLPVLNTPARANETAITAQTSEYGGGGSLPPSARSLPIPPVPVASKPVTRTKSFGAADDAQPFGLRSSAQQPGPPLDNNASVQGAPPPVSKSQPEKVQSYRPTGIGSSQQQSLQIHSRYQPPSPSDSNTSSVHSDHMFQPAEYDETATHDQANMSRIEKAQPAHPPKRPQVSPLQIEKAQSLYHSTKAHSSQLQAQQDPSRYPPPPPSPSGSTTSSVRARRGTIFESDQFRKTRLDLPLPSPSFTDNKLVKVQSNKASEPPPSPIIFRVETLNLDNVFLPTDLPPFHLTTFKRNSNEPAEIFRESRRAAKDISMSWQGSKTHSVQRQLFVQTSLST